MTATDKLLVTQTKQRVIVTQEFRMEDDLDPVGWIIEEVASLESLNDGILVSILHIVSGDGWPGNDQLLNSTISLSFTGLE